MILVDRKRASAPRKLLRDGPVHLRDIIEPLVKANKLTSDDFKGTIYASDVVKHRLWEMQHRKCCFCERKYEKKHSTVEHFRPKSEASDDTRNRGNKRRGYWWLAYTFENLYFCCQNCNTPKATYFPLAPGSAPLAAKTLPTAANERAQILDPGGPADPEAHVDWIWSSRRKSYVPVGTTTLGRNTIYAAELDQRDGLNKLRADYYKGTLAPVLRRYREARKAGDAALLALVGEDVQRLSHPRTPYAGMARFIFRKKKLL